MKIPEISVIDGRRAWMVAPHEGLLSSEIAPVIGESACSIRAAIHEQRLPGVVFKVDGLIYAYGSRVDDIRLFYGLSANKVAVLKKMTGMDAPQQVMNHGPPMIHIGGRGEHSIFEISHEFKNLAEFYQENPSAPPSVG